MVRGVDVWVNTPQPPWEACGTSGMRCPRTAASTRPPATDGGRKPIGRISAGASRPEKSTRRRRRTTRMRHASTNCWSTRSFRRFDSGRRLCPATTSLNPSFPPTACRGRTGGEEVECTVAKHEVSRPKSRSSQCVACRTSPTAGARRPFGALGAPSSEGAAPASDPRADGRHGRGRGCTNLPAADAVAQAPGSGQAAVRPRGRRRGGYHDASDTGLTSGVPPSSEVDHRPKDYPQRWRHKSNGSGVTGAGVNWFLVDPIPS